MKTISLLLIAATATFAQWGGFGGGGGKSINDYKKESVSGRDIHVYAPSNLAPKSPLLLSLHGMDQDPNYQQSMTHWENVADTAGFVVVYPRGGTGMSTWDISGDQDTKWVTEIIDQMVKEYDIDTKRVYLSGFSMGGMFTYHAMSKIADKIAAFAPCSGPNVFGASKAMRPVPIFHPHGTNDDVLQYSSVEDFIKNYRDQFNCPAQAEVKENYPNSENQATLYSWGPCDGGVYVKHLKLQGRGHSPSTADVSDIWNFVKEYTVDGPISANGDKDQKDTVTNDPVTDPSKVDSTKTDSTQQNPVVADTNKTDSGAVNNDKTDNGGLDASDKNDANGNAEKPVVDTNKIDSPIAIVANSTLLLNVEKNYSVYDMRGVFVCNLKAARVGDVQVLLNSMKLNKGLYVVKNGAFNRIFSVK